MQKEKNQLIRWAFLRGGGKPFFIWLKQKKEIERVNGFVSEFMLFRETKSQQIMKGVIYETTLLYVVHSMES